MKNRAIESAFQLVDTCDKTDLSSLLSYINKFVKICTKEMKRKVKTSKKSDFWNAMEELKKIDEMKKLDSYNRVFNSN